MCLSFGGSKPKPPDPLPPPPQTPTVNDEAVTRSRADETARLRALAGSASTSLTAGKTLDATAMGGKTKLGQ